MWKLVEFKCTNCDHQFEDMIDTNGAGTADCPECHMPAVVTVGLSAYGKHGSWSQWSAMDKGNE